MENNLVEIFKEVREIPYHIPESPNEEDYRCWGKNRILLKKFLEAGYEARLIVCKFFWSEQKIPKEIISIAPSDKDFHPFVEVKIDGNWIKVDSTLDSSFPKYNEWDGKTDTKISIKYNKILSPEESQEINSKEDSSNKSNEWYEFYKKLNKFFDKVKNN